MKQEEQDCDWDNRLGVFEQVTKIYQLLHYFENNPLDI